MDMTRGTLRELSYVPFAYLICIIIVAYGFAYVKSATVSLICI